MLKIPSWLFLFSHQISYNSDLKDFCLYWPHWYDQQFIGAVWKAPTEAAQDSWERWTVAYLWCFGKTSWTCQHLHSEWNLTNDGDTVCTVLSLKISLLYMYCIHVLNGVDMRGICLYHCRKVWTVKTLGKKHVFFKLTCIEAYGLSGIWLRVIP